MIDQNSSLDEFSEYLETFNKEMQQKIEEMQKNLAAIIRNAMDSIEGAKEVAWYQYIPGFNDGDACEFTVGEIGILFEGGEDTTLTPDNIDEYSSWGIKNEERLTKDQKNKAQKLLKTLASIPDAVMQTFGTNAFIKVTKENIEIDEYDCGY